MPRKKSVKRSGKRQAKKPEASKSSILANARKAEQQLMQMPGKLAKQLSKEISAQKKREAKLKNLSAKQKILAKKTETRMSAILNAKATPTSNKKLAKAKKLLKQADKSFNQAHQQLNTISEHLTKLVDEQAKFASLGKYLNQFDQDWDKSSRTEKPKKTKAKAKAKRKIKAVAAPEQQPATQAEETPFDQLGFDEVTELAS